MCRYLLLYMLQNQVSDTNWAINAQLLEDFLIFGIVNPSDSSRHPKFMFSYLTGNQVVLILIGSCYKHLSPGYASLSQSSHFTAIPSNTHASHFILKVFTLGRILIQHQYLMPFLQQCFTQVIADAATTNDYYVH